MITDRVRERLAADFPGPALADATALVERIPVELSMWKEVTSTDRVELAVLILADGDLDGLRRALDIARRDWRNALVWAGIG